MAKMKKVLVTGASGSLGICVLEYLLNKKKYEITAVDLNCKENKRKLRKFRKKINIFYNDINDQKFVDSIIKEYDYVIHLAGAALPLCNLKPTFGLKIDYESTNNIVRSISYYNPDCFLVYPSTTSLYKKSSNPITIRSKIQYDNEDYFSNTKEKCENIIKSKLQNYTILRFPFILNDEIRSIFLYKKNEEVELITNSIAAKALSEALENKQGLNKKVKIVSGGENYRINTSELFLRMLEIYGYSGQLLWNKLFNPYRYDGNIYKEDETIKKMLKERGSLDKYLKSLKKKKRLLNKFLSIPYKKELERSIQK